MRKTCPFCCSNKIKLNGHYSNKKQRFYCLKCNKSFSRKNKSVKNSREFIWFKLWITEGYSVRQLSKISKHSKSKLYNIINHWLSNVPKINNTDLISCKYAMFDGTYLHRPNSMVVLMNAETNSLVAGKFDVRENSSPQLYSFFEPIKDAGFMPKSFTLDGNPQVINVVKNIWTGVIVQRCLVHIQRQGIMWCRRFPKRTDAKHLRRLFKRVTCIETIKERDDFLFDVKIWEQKYGCHIDIKTETGKVFSDIKRARSMLIKAIPNMFHYLGDTNIPKTTNGLEGYFSRLKSNYRNHRGLKPEKRTNYFKWFFILKSK